jgi:Fur family iron response transcriptional regulator
VRTDTVPATSDVTTKILPATPDGAPMAVRPSRGLMEQYGLRATRQRVGLAKLLFGGGHRHVTADALAGEARAANMSASLATVYNVLNLFADVGLVRALPIAGTKTIFDTNTTDHAHFFYEETATIEDIPVARASTIAAIDPPEGFEIVRVDVVVRLRCKNSSAGPVQTPVVYQKDVGPASGARARCAD